MTFDEETDAYDPLIAQHFELLNRAVPVEVPHATGRAEHRVSDPVEQPTLLTPRTVSPAESASRPLYLLAAAAAMVIVAGGAVFALTNLGDDPDLRASNGGDVQLQVDDEEGSTAEVSSADENDTNRSLTVEVPDPAAENSTADSQANGTQDGTSDEATDADSADGQPESGDGDGSSAENGPAEENGSQGTVAESQTTDPPAEPTTTTTQPSTTQPPSSETTTTTEAVDVTDLTPNSSWLNPPDAEKMVTIRGMVTEVFTDCQSRLILNDQDEVESVGPVSCDGGSHIIVNGTRIQTASGYLMSEADMYGKHLSTLRPGQNVSVTAVPTASAGGMLTLNCVLCQIKLGG